MPAANFPNSTWDGRSDSRSDRTAVRSPDGEDWEQLKVELQAIENLLTSNFNLTTTNASAAVQVDSTTKGLLVPRMTTTQRNAITSPAEGLLIYNITTHAHNLYNGTVWQAITAS